MSADVHTHDSSKTLDEKRHLQTAYEYLCHLEEAKVWMEHHLHVELPNSSELEEHLRNGVILARLANFFAPELITERKIYDKELVQFQKKGLHFKYTDNIMNFVRALSHIGFPKVFFPETTDIYDMKNMPKLIYCIHALSFYLYKLGKAQPIQDLFGKVQFSDDELLKVSESLKKYGVQMPAFSKIGGILASELSEDDAALHAAILLINESLDSSNVELVNERLKNVAAQIYGIHDEYGTEYMNHMISERNEKIKLTEEKKLNSNTDEDVYDRLLTQKELQSVINNVNLDKKLIQVTQASRTNDEDKLIECLTSRDLGARAVLYDNRDLYLKYMTEYVTNQNDDYIFDMNTVNSMISKGNSDADIRKRIVMFVKALNNNIENLSAEGLLKYFSEYNVEIGTFDAKLIDSYTQWIKHAHEMKIKATNDSNVGLWFDEVKQCISDCNKAVKEAKSLITKIEQINLYAMSQDVVDASTICTYLHDLKLNGIVDDCKNKYAENIHDIITNQNFVDWNGWTEHKLSSTSNQNFNFNHTTKSFTWFNKVNIQDKHGYINKETIQLIINNITARHNEELYLLANSTPISIIQAFIRTHHTRLSYIQRPHIILLQSLVRTLRVMNMFKNVNDFNQQHVNEIEFLQRVTKTYLIRKKLCLRFELFKENIDKIVAIQSVIRASLAHRDYHNLVHSTNPPCSAVCRFVRLLEVDANDMKEEHELSQLRSSVLTMIKDINEKEAENREFDVRIGLLVKNKLKLQDVLSHNQGKSSKKLNEYFLPTITKEKQAIIDKLGTLFYILQMNPEYTAQLILRFFGDRNSKFIRETCFALYNYGTYLRDEYTLIKMFSRAMVLEIETKIDSIQDFIKGDPLILKIVVNYYRNSKAQTWLEEVICSCVKDVVNSKYSINTNPLDIYKQWINQMETETGQASNYPYDVDTETAMSYDEVKKRLSTNITNMKEVCSKFVEAITSSATKMPYGVRYVARVLFDTLKAKFPEDDDSSYFKVISNFLYYRLINPAIVSPDTFNMLASAEISAEKRKNLASISVVIQRSASHNFSPISSNGDNPMYSLNDYMASTWLKMINWFTECIQVDDLELHFNIDEFTDQTAITRPELNLTMGQIVEVYGMVKSYIREHNLPKDDPVVVVMDDIGELPPPIELVERKKAFNDNTPDDDDQIDALVMNVSFTLPLIPPKIEENNDEANKKILFSDTIKYVVSLMNFEATDNFSRLLNKQFTRKQEKEFVKFQTTRNSQLNEMKNELTTGTSGTEPDSIALLTLAETQKRIIENTKKLEELGAIAPSNDYQSLVVAVAREIRNRRIYRKNRRFDLLRMRSALENLNAKDKYLCEQKDYYQQYIQACVANLDSSKKSKQSKSKTKKVVKYNAAELYKQGVVLEVEGLSPSQFKNVQFEIVSTDDPGVFSVSAKLFGVSMDSMELVFQDLLQLQYENVSVISMFDRAKINVNLLIYTINKKFYSKK